MSSMHSTTSTRSALPNAARVQSSHGAVEGGTLLSNRGRIRLCFLDSPAMATFDRAMRERSTLAAGRCCGCVPCPYAALGVRVDALGQRHRTWVGRLLALVQCPVCGDMFSDALHSPFLQATLLGRLVLTLTLILYLEGTPILACFASDEGVEGDVPDTITLNFDLVNPNGAPTTFLYALLTLLAMLGNSAWHGRVWTVCGFVAWMAHLGLFLHYDAMSCFNSMEGLGIVSGILAAVFLLYDGVASLFYLWVLLAWVCGIGDFPRTPWCRLEVSRPQPWRGADVCCPSPGGCSRDCGKSRSVPLGSAPVGRGGRDPRVSGRHPSVRAGAATFRAMVSTSESMDVQNPLSVVELVRTTPPSSGAAASSGRESPTMDPDGSGGFLTPAVVGSVRLVDIPARLWLAAILALTASLGLAGAIGYGAGLLSGVMGMLQSKTTALESAVKTLNDDSVKTEDAGLLLLLDLALMFLSSVQIAAAITCAVIALAGMLNCGFHLWRYRRVAQALVARGYCEASVKTALRAHGVTTDMEFINSGSSFVQSWRPVLQWIATVFAPDGAAGAQFWGRVAGWLTRSAPPPPPPPLPTEGSGPRLRERSQEKGTPQDTLLEEKEEVAASTAVVASSTEQDEDAASVTKKRSTVVTTLTAYGSMVVKTFKQLTTRRYAWSDRPLGFVHDIELTSFPMERAISFPGLFLANTLTASVLLSLIVFLLAFLCVFPFTQQWVLNLLIAQAIAYAAKLVFRFLVSFLLVGREGIHRHRCLAGIDVCYGLTIGAVVGALTGLTRVLTIAGANAIMSFRVDAPMTPRGLESMDTAFVAWASMIHARADAEAFGPERDAVMARWCCIPRPIEVDSDEPCDSCKLCSFGGTPVDTRWLE
jgi:hypothetical protein